MGLRCGHLRIIQAAVIAFAICLVALAAAAQQPKILAPHDPIAPKMSKPMTLASAVAGSMVGGPWMIDANFKSTIYLKNVVETAPITVTPVLHLSNAAKYVLPAVTLQPGGTDSVDIGAGLQSLGIASYATLSGYVELQYQWPWVPLCAFIRDVDVAHSMIFTFGIQAPGNVSATQQSASQITEGLWWKQEANVTGFLTLTNISAKPITALVQVSDDHAAVLGTQTVTVSPQGMKTLNLQELQTAPTNQGGLRIAYAGQQGTLLINGGLEDPGVGYSANLYFSADPIALPPQAKLTALNGVAELGLMVGAADPMMRFPAGTTFTPYSVLRNTSSNPISITATLWWMQGGAPISAALPAITLLPFETRSLDMPTLLATVGLKNFGGSVNLVFDYQSRSGLLFAAGSVDQTNTYVFEVAPRGIGNSAGKSISYWSTANGDDTMITVWNPADEAQDFVFRMDFAGGQYSLPLHLEARATRMFSVSEIIQNQIPDPQGNVIPASIQSGSAKLIGSQADNQHILAVMDGGIYNVVKATCGGFCMGCDGATTYYAIIDGFYVPIGRNQNESFMAQWNTGAQYDLSSQSSWQSSNTNTATVQSGSVHGVAVGKVTIGVGDSSEPDYVPYQCFYQPFSCSFAQGGGGSASGTVISISGVSTLIYGVTNGPLTITGSGFSLLTGTLSITFDDPAITGTGTVSNDGLITGTYTVACASLVGVHTIYISSSGTDGGGPGASSPVSVSLPGASAPSIQFGGNNVTGTTQSVVVGQQIVLSASVSLPACTSISSQQWTPSASATAGTPIGGYSTTTPAAVTPLPPRTNSSYTFYWAYPASSVQATYQYTMSGGGASASSPVAVATFNITGPTGGSMSSIALSKLYIATLTACGSFPAGPYLVYASNATGSHCSLSATSAGMNFNTPTGYSNASGGSFVVGQLLSHDTLTGGGTTYGPGLDSSWPYAAGTLPTNDSPLIYLASTYRTLTRDFQATMFLMWKSSTSNSILVPLGYQTWAFSATASCTTSCGSASNWSVTTHSAGLVGGFTVSNSSQSSVGQNTLQYGYPTWTSVSF